MGRRGEDLGGWLHEGQSKRSRLVSPVSNAKPQRGRKEREGLGRLFFNTEAQRHRALGVAIWVHAEPQRARRLAAAGF